MEGGREGEGEGGREVGGKGKEGGSDDVRRKRAGVEEGRVEEGRIVEGNEPARDRTRQGRS